MPMRERLLPDLRPQQVAMERLKQMLLPRVVFILLRLLPMPGRVISMRMTLTIPLKQDRLLLPVQERVAIVVFMQMH